MLQREFRRFILPSVARQVATVSPSSDQFEETLNTLKYANRAKNIITKAVTVHLEPSLPPPLEQLAQVRELQAEIAATTPLPPGMRSGSKRGGIWGAALSPPRSRLGRWAAPKMSRVAVDTELSDDQAWTEMNGSNGDGGFDPAASLRVEAQEVRRDQ